MEELQLALTAARVDQRNFGLWINNWQIGQTLNALVTNQLPSGDLVLRVGGQQITATSDIPIQQGASLLLEVKQLQPVPTLRVLSPVTAAASDVGGTLRLLPAGASGLASTPLANVAQSLQNTLANLAMPAMVADSLGQLLRRISRPERLVQPQGLASALRESGVFLESGLNVNASSRPGVAPGDFKAGIFRALAQVDAALSRVQALALPTADAEALLELKRELEAGLGRITLHQLNSQPLEPQSPRQWQLEIPVQVAEKFHSLHIDVEQKPGRQDALEDDDPDRWTVQLQLAPDALGAIDIRLQLQGNALDLRIGASRQSARSLIDAGIPILSQALASRGITMTTVPAAPLVEEPPAQAVENPVSGKSVDLRA